MAYIFIDENQSCQFDFSAAIWATNELNTIYHNAKVQLSDVDFIVETETEILFIEYKNAKYGNMAFPERFKPSEDKTINKVVRKYYDSYMYVKALGKDEHKRLIYVYILEYPQGDLVSRKFVRERMAGKLPFSLQRQEHFQQNWIDAVVVLNIEEWNDLYSQFPATILATTGDVD